MNERWILLYSCISQLANIWDVLVQLDFCLLDDIDRARNMKEDDLIPFPEASQMEIDKLIENSNEIEYVLDNLKFSKDRLESLVSLKQ